LDNENDPVLALKVYVRLKSVLYLSVRCALVYVVLKGTLS